MQMLMKMSTPMLEHIRELILKETSNSVSQQRVKSYVEFFLGQNFLPLLMAKLEQMSEPDLANTLERIPKRILDRIYTLILKETSNSVWQQTIELLLEQLGAPEQQEIQSEAGTSLQPVAPVTVSVDAAGWRHLQCYINPDNSLTEAGMELATRTQQEALTSSRKADRSIDFPQILAYIAENPKTNDEIKKFCHCHGIDSSPSMYVDFSGELTAAGVIKGYAYLKKFFEPLSPGHIKQLITIRCNDNLILSGIEMFKLYGISPYVARRYISVSSEGAYKLTTPGIEMMHKNPSSSSQLLPIDLSSKAHLPR